MGSFVIQSASYVRPFHDDNFNHVRKTLSLSLWPSIA